MRCCVTKPTPYIPRDHRVSGLLLANHSRFGTVFDEIGANYDRLYSKNAYIERYQKDFGQDFICQMTDAREKLSTITELYRDAGGDGFLCPEKENSCVKAEESFAEHAHEAT